MENLTKQTIAGIEFEAVQAETRGIKHWLAKLPNGQIVEPGVFAGESRPKLWKSMRHTLKIVGQQRFLAGFNLGGNTHA